MAVFDTNYTDPDNILWYFKVYKQSVGKFAFRLLATGVVTLSPT
jgi:hypothetical protein